MKLTKLCVNLKVNMLQFIKTGEEMKKLHNHSKSQTLKGRWVNDEN